MRILIAEDDPTSRQILAAVLQKQGHQVVATQSGQEALDAMRRDDAPRLAVLDWMMPGLDGLDVCRQLREEKPETPPYVIMLTSFADRAHLVQALDAGADDYVTKPFDSLELRARVDVGIRMLAMQERLLRQSQELREALDRVKTLRGLIPICCSCKRVRDDQDYWREVVEYVTEHTEALFTHGLCPECEERLYPFDDDE